LAAPVWAGQVDLAVPAETPAAPTAVMPTASVGTLALPAPNLAPAALAAPAVAALPAAAVFSPLAAAPNAATAAALAPAVAAPTALPEAAGHEVAAAATPAPALVPSAAFKGATPEAAYAETEDGRIFFDAAAAPRDRPGFWARAHAWFSGAGAPRPGSKVRAEGRPYTLERLLSDRGGVQVWKAREGDYVVTLQTPNASTARRVERLRELARADLPFIPLSAAAADGSVMVSEAPRSQSAAELLEAGFTRSQTLGWTELAAKLIHAGYGADLSPTNLIYVTWRSRWVLADPNSLAPAGPENVLAQMLSPGARAAGVDAAEFLAGVRGRFGPDSPEWARTSAALASPRFAAERAALDARDRALPPPPAVAFGPEPGAAPFPDRVATPAEIARALGYDPLLQKKSRTMLHTDDPGKQNTEVFSVSPPGMKKVAVKISSWGIVRRELALRRVVRRFFGTYFETPSAFGVKRGLDSYLVMEFHPGVGGYSHPPIDRAARAALGVLVHAFGVSDMNPGNVLFGSDHKPALIDFEQSLFVSAPVANRLPDERIATEMPWLSRRETNRIDDFEPAVRAWRRTLADPANRRALEADFAAAGYEAEEVPRLMAIVDLNTSRLDWTLQNDVDFVNQFVRTRAGTTEGAHP
jgi:hypothetical protein